MNCARCGGELNLGDARSAVLRLMEQRAELLDALQDLTAQILADWQSDCTELLPESAEFKAALVAIAKAEGES